MENSNPAAERAVLSGIIKGGNETYLDTSDILKEEFFTLEASQVTYKCIKHILDKDSSSKLDLTTILSTAHEIGLAKFFGEKSAQNYLRSLTQLDINPENVRSEAKKIAKLAITRILYSKLEEAQKDLCGVSGSESISQIVSIAESKISDLMNLYSDDSVKTMKMGDGADIWLENILANPQDVVGISTGFGLFDSAIGGGMERKTVHLIAARMKVGKSALTDTIGLHVAGKLGIPVLNIDTEMSQEKHLARICANITSIDSILIKKGKVNTTEANKLREAVKYIKSIPYHYRCVAGYPFEDILAVIRRWVTKDVGKENGKTRDCLVIFDYFKLMDADTLKSMAEFQALGFQLSKMTDFAIKYDIPILAFAQTNRDGASEYTMETIADSDRLGRFASSVSIFARKSSEEIGQEGIENGNRKLYPLVSRDGPGFEDGNYINMNFRGEFCKITELGTRNMEYKKRELAKQKEEQSKQEEVTF